MSVIVRKIEKTDLKKAIDIWNEVVFEGVAFPQEEPLTIDGGEAFFNAQTYVAVAESAETGEVLGLYILAPQQRRQVRSYRERELLRVERGARTRGG